MKNIQNLIFYKKGYSIFCSHTPPSLKTVVSSHKWFFEIFSENTVFSINLFNNKIYGTKFEIEKGFINFFT